MFHKIVTIAIIVWTLLMLVWIVTGLAGNVQRADEIAGEGEAAQAGYAVGTGLGVGMLFCIWAVGAAMLLVLWLVTRPRRAGAREPAE